MLRLLLALLATPAVAQTRCPTAADLATGIRVLFEDGSAETFRLGGPGLVEVAGREPDGARYRLSLAHGHHLLSFQAVAEDGTPDPASLVTYDYGRPPSDLPLPEPLGRFSSDVTVTDAGGPRQEPQMQAFGPLTAVTLGGCAFDAVEAAVAYDTPEGYTEGLLWLPGLGISILTWQQPGTDARVDFPLLSIGAGK